MLFRQVEKFLKNIGEDAECETTDLLWRSYLMREQILNHIAQSTALETVGVESDLSATQLIRVELLRTEIIGIQNTISHCMPQIPQLSATERTRSTYVSGDDRIRRAYRDCTI